MLKKIAVGLGVILLTSTLAPAESKSSIDPASASVMGVMEGAMNFCSKVSPGTPSGYNQIDQFILKGQSEKTISRFAEALHTRTLSIRPRSCCRDCHPRTL